MKTRLLIIIGMIGLGIITINTIYAQCAPDPNNTRAPCHDNPATLIIQPHEAKIESIDGQLFYVIGPFSLQKESDDRIRLNGVTFTYPSYPNPPVPGGQVYVTIAFDDGTKDSISKVGAPFQFVEFREHQDQQAGVRRNADGTFNFLLSAYKQSISPLKQFKSGILFDEIQCRENLVLVQKYDGSPACVTAETAVKLTARINWTYQIVSFTYDGKLNEKLTNAFSNGITEIINSKHGKLTYYATPQVIDDKYLGKTVEEWQQVSRHELELQNEAVPDHKFYENLGTLLIKNEMIYQMHMLGIENIDDDFRVLSGSQLDSLPPYIGFSSVVNATDGHYYLLSGGTHANQVDYYKTTQLQYPDESKFPKIKTTPNLSDDGKIPRITITEVGGNDLMAEPYSVILSQPGDVEFYNETPETLTVYLNEEGVEEFSFDTSQEISTRSNSGMAFPFSGAGVYSFHAQVPKNIDGKEYELNTGGAITVLADDMSNLPMPVKMEIAKEILISSDIPISSLGQQGTDDVISIRLNTAIEKMLPESKSYYLNAAQNLIPFDIKIALR